MKMSLRCSLMTLALFAVSTAQAVTIRYVAQDGQTPDPLGHYTEWSNAASNIQDAVNAAVANDLVLVGPGRYTAPQNPTNYAGPNVVYIGKPLTLRSSEGREVTLIDGEGSNRCVAVFFSAGSGTSPYVIDGFTFTNGYAVGFGGGVFMTANNERVGYGEVNNSLFIDNVVDHGQHLGFFNNGTGAKGGGFASYTFTVNLYITLSNNVFRGNETIGPANDSVSGGGFHAQGYTQLNVTRCLIEYNKSHHGGGVYIGWPNTQMDRTIIRRNNATGWGGGLYVHFTTQVRDPWIRNTLIYHNTANTAGGLLANTGNRRVYLQNSTIVSNYASAGVTAGVDIRSSGSGDRGIVAWNSIITDNRPKNLHGSGTLLAESFFTNNCTYPITDLVGENNIDLDPKFVDFEGADFRLRVDSPCINAGVNQLDWMTDATDLAGNPRLDGVYQTVDIGAYEYHYQGSILLVR